MSKKTVVRKAARAIKAMNRGRAEMSAAKQEVKEAVRQLRNLEHAKDLLVHMQQQQTPEVLVSLTEQRLREGLQAFATVLSLGEALPVPQKAQFFTLVKSLGKVFEENERALRNNLLEYIKSHGQPINENGSLEAQVEGYRLPANRTPPKYDDKKVEGMLRSKGIPVVAGMRSVEVYETDVVKLERLLTLEPGTSYFGLVTLAELEACKTTEKWAVQEPKPVKEVQGE